MLLVYTTWPDAASAAAAARALVEERLCACATMLAPGASIFRWDGAVTEAAETVMLLKTTADAAPRLRDRLRALHPYELPCILAFAPDECASAKEFASWVRAEVS